MPFAEVFNALLITYIATEYSLTNSSSSASSSLSAQTPASTSSPKKTKKDGFDIRTFLSARHNQIVLLVVISVNLIDKLILAESATASFIKQFFERLLHAPKILLAAILYVVVLYIDCLKHTRQQLPIRRFLGCVGVQFLKILPLYPFLVVLISFGFMVFISLLEHLHIPLEWLNWPLYYGTLYGPFSFVYFQVKAKIIEEGKYFIPTSRVTRGASGMSSDTSLSMRKLRLAYFCRSTTKKEHYSNNEEILSYTGEYVTFDV
jgi:hypothetical protein